MGMNLKKWAALISIAAIGMIGCAKSNVEWLHPNPQSVNTQRDFKECEAKSKRADPGAGEIFTLGLGGSYMAKNAEEWKEIEKCMNEKGYTAKLD